MPTWGSIRNNTLYSLGLLSQQIARLQEMAATGKRVNRASDAPGDAFTILHLQSEQRSLKMYSNNLADLTGTMEQVSSLMGEVSGILTRGQQLVAQGATATLSAGNRVAIGNELNALLEQVVSIANTRSMGRHVFGGAMLQRPPYEVDRRNGQITAVRYQGSYEELRVAAAPGIEYPGTVVGDDVFRQDKRTGPSFYGQTGVAAGRSTASVRGDAWLEVRHAGTTYADGGASGLVPAPGGDTAVGTHQITVLPDGTIQLDDGPAVALSGQSDLLLTNAAGDTVRVDASGYGAWTGTFDITVSAEMSIDRFATATAVTHTSDQPVIDSQSGRVLYVDTTQIQRTGYEPVRVPGTYDMFGTLIEIRDLLLNTRSLSNGEQASLLAQASESLEEVKINFTQGMTSIGGRLQAMEVLTSTLENLHDNASQHIARLEEADIVQIATDLSHIQSYYEMTLASTSKLLSVSLLDYM